MSGFVSEEYVGRGLKIKITPGQFMALSAMNYSKKSDSLALEMERVVGLEVRCVLLEKLQEIETDVIGRTHICKGCRSVFVSKRKGLDIKWCDNCRKD